MNEMDLALRKLVVVLHLSHLIFVDAKLPSQREHKVRTVNCLLSLAWLEQPENQQRFSVEIIKIDGFDRMVANPTSGTRARY